MKIIPFSTLPDFSETVALDTKTWLLRFQWNSKFGFWSMSIADVNGVLIDGLRLVPNLFMLQSHGKDNLPEGDFVVLSPNASTAPIGRNNIGQDLDYQILYFTQDEVNATL